ncbi:DUF1877 family protein [Streptomyces sp. SID6041]|nr:DUF1877 family protein [Streptomyces sp. SID6041]
MRPGDARKTPWGRGGERPRGRDGSPSGGVPSGRPGDGVGSWDAERPRTGIPVRGRAQIRTRTGTRTGSALADAQLLQDQVLHAGRVRLTAERVRVAVAALEAHAPDSLTDGVTPADLADANVYPQIVWERGEEPDWVAAHWADLANYLRAAAREGDAMLLWIS